jgi:hypothetical protein
MSKTRETKKERKENAEYNLEVKKKRKEVTRGHDKSNAPGLGSNSPIFACDFGTMLFTRAIEFLASLNRLHRTAITGLPVTIPKKT